MAGVKVSKIRILGLKADRESIMNVLERSARFEVIPTSDLGKGEKNSDPVRINAAKAKQSKVTFAIDYLASINEEAADIIALDAKKAKNKKRYPDFVATEFSSLPEFPKKGRQLISYDDFYTVSAKEFELFSIISEIKLISEKRQDIKIKKSKLTSFAEELQAYLSDDTDIFAESNSMTLIVAKGKSGVNPLKSIDVYTETYPFDDGVIIGILAKKDLVDSVNDALTKADFIVCDRRSLLKAYIDKVESLTRKYITTDEAQINQSIDEIKKSYQSKDNTEFEIVSVLVEKNAEQIKKLYDADIALINKALSYNIYLQEFQILYDVVGREIERSVADTEFVKTDTTFVLEGWAPHAEANQIIEAVKEKAPLTITEVLAPAKGEKAPTILKNNPIVRPFESITDMYMPPAYGEFDPNGIMSIFFFIIFGLMMGDAGYGLVLSLACFFIITRFKLEKGAKSLVTIFGICGLSAIVWGLLLGGVFSIPTIVPLWFNPLEEPITMLILSIVVGAIHLLAGYALNMYKKIKAGVPLDGVLDNIFYFVLLGGAGVLGLSFALEPLSQLLSTVGLYTMLAAVIAMMLAAARKGRGVGGKIGAAFNALYGLLGLFSDLLSYSRIFGLALASAAIGLAFNMIGGMFFGSIAGYIIGGILLVVLHGFNLAIGLLGTYINNIRLQYLEFYGRFYEGDGKLFAPLGSETKYVRFS